MDRTIVLVDLDTNFIKFIGIILIFALLAGTAVYRGQNIRRLDFKNLIAEFWPKNVVPSKSSPQQIKNESISIIEQHTEGDQSPNVNVGPGGASRIHYETKPRGNRE